LHVFLIFTLLCTKLQTKIALKRARNASVSRLFKNLNKGVVKLSTVSFHVIIKNGMKIDKTIRIKFKVTLIQPKTCQTPKMQVSKPITSYYIYNRRSTAIIRCFWMGKYIYDFIN